MTTIRYKRQDMVFQAIGCVALATGAGWALLAMDLGLQLWIVCVIFILALPVVAIALGIRASGDLTALSFDRDGISVCTLWRKSRFLWRNVKSVHRETLEQSSGFGFFKQTVGWYLVVTFHEGDGFEKREKINEKLLDLPHDQMELLVARICAAWAGVGVEAPSKPMPQPAGHPSFGRKLA